MTGPRLRTALVLGGGSDIALATVRSLVPLGLDAVVLAVRDPDTMGPALESIPPSVRVTVVAWDVTDLAAHETLVRSASADLGTVDVVLAAVGVLGHHAGIELAPTEVASMVATNFGALAAALNVVATALLHQGHGTIVVFSSVAGVRPRRSNFVYGASKAGLDAFARGLGDAVSDTPIRVLIVRPGFVHSKMTTGLRPAPFATGPDAVAAAVVSAVVRPRCQVVWVPAILRPLFAVLGVLPASWWRRIAGDR